MDRNYFGEDISSALPPPCIRCCPQQQTHIHSERGLSVWSCIVNRRGAVLMRSIIAASLLKVGGPHSFLLRLSAHVSALCAFVFGRNGAMQRLHSSFHKRTRTHKNGTERGHLYDFTFLLFMYLCVFVLLYTPVFFCISEGDREQGREGNGKRRKINACLLGV